MKYFKLIFILVLYVFSATAQPKNLNYYIQSAQLNSPLLKDYNNQKLANLIDSLRIQASLKPQVFGNSVNSYSPVIGGWGYDGAITNGANFSQLVVATKQFVPKANINNQYESIRLLNESLNVTGKITSQDIGKAITAQYITAHGNFEQIGFNTSLLNLLKKEESILKTLTEKGVYRQTDYLSFLVTMQQQEIQIAQIKVQFQNDFATLNYLAGINDTSAVSLEAPNLELLTIAEAEGTVFYQQYRIDSLRLKNQDVQIDLNYKPKVSAYVDGGYLTSFSEQYYKNFGTSFGVSVILPIYDGKQRKMQHDKISISEQTRQTYRDYFKRQYVQQVAQLTQQLKSTQALIDQLNNQIKYTETLVEANRKLLFTGDVRMADYIIAIGNYMNAKNNIRINNINKLQIINQINYWNSK
jgi:outer membrane protein TolC